MMGARFAGATTVIAVDRRRTTSSPRRSSSGSPRTAIDSSTTDPVAAVLELTGGRGADYGFDAVGVTGTLDLVDRGDPPGRDVRGHRPVARRRSR